MANNGILVDTILDSFPIKDITKHSGEPTFQAIRDSHNQLKANAASILADISGGHFGLLGLTIQQKSYETLTGSPFVKHTNPGIHPIYPKGISAETTAEILRQHKVNKGAFHIMHNTDLTLTKQIISDFDGLYLKGIKIRYVKFLGVPSFDIIQHIYNNYGTLNQVDIYKNNKTMSKNYDPTLPIKVLFDKIEEGTEVAKAASCPYNKNQILEKAYLLILQTGKCKEACTEWNRKAVGNHLWLILKAHFSKSHRENRHIEQATAQVSGSANAAVNEENEGYHRETTAEIQTLVEATEMDRIHVANQVAENTILKRIIKKITTEMATIKNLMGTIQAQINQLALKIPQGIVHPVQAQTHNRVPVTHTPDTNESYLWTHGRTRNNAHTSVTCRNNKTGHIRTATLQNRCGGSDKWITTRTNV